MTVTEVKWNIPSHSPLSSTNSLQDENWLRHATFYPPFPFHNRYRAASTAQEWIWHEFFFFTTLYEHSIATYHVTRYPV
jgi:hypothetical protein